MAAVSTQLEVINLALRELGQKKITQPMLDSPEKDSPADKMSENYDPVRLGLIRQFCFEFCTEQLPLAKIDPDGFVVAGAGTDAANGAFSHVDGTSYEYDHESLDSYVLKVSGTWAFQNEAGTETYYTTTDEADKPWDVATWELGTDGSAAVPRVYPGTPRDYNFLYKRPSDCVTPWAIWNPSSRKPDDKIRFKPFRNQWIACDMDDAVLVYARDEDDVTLFDELFVLCFSKALALSNYVSIKGSDKGMATLRADLQALLLQTQSIDAAAQHEDRDAILGRRYTDL